MRSNKQVKVALLFSAIGQYSAELIGFVTIMVIARLLSPDEIGVYAIAGSVILIATELRTLGAVQYLVREQDIPGNKIREVLGVSVVVSWGLGLLLLFLSPYISEFYAEPDLKQIFWILSVTFFVGPFTGVPFALWMREMEFKQIFIMKVTGELTTSLGAISLVLLGFSYFGLAFGVIIGLFSRLLVAILLQPAGTVWMPAFSLRRDLIRFGLFTSSSSLFKRFSEGMPDLVIGRFGSMADVGQFSRGFGAILFLNKLLVSAVGPVVLPHLSEVRRTGGQVAEAYLRSIKILVAFTWPVFAVASAAAYPLIYSLFGDQWSSAVSVTPILAYWAMVTSVHGFSASAFIATGAEGLMFLSALFVYVLMLTMVIFAAPHGLTAVAWALVVSGVIELVVKTLALKRSLGLMVGRLIVTLWPNFIIALVCWLAAALIDQAFPFEETDPWQSLGVIALCMPIVWLGMLRLTKHEVWDLVWDILGKIIPVPSGVK